MPDERRLIEALVARAVDAARDFRAAYPLETPTDLWIENSYTAALPLAKSESGIDPGPDPHPPLFAAYRETIDRILGEREYRKG
jgi:hypothetical protein